MKNTRKIHEKCRKNSKTWVLGFLLSIGYVGGLIVNNSAPYSDLEKYPKNLKNKQTPV